MFRSLVLRGTVTARSHALLQKKLWGSVTSRFSSSSRSPLTNQKLRQTLSFSIISTTRKTSHKRLFSSVSTQAAAPVVSKNRSSFDARVRLLARVIRYTRIPFLMVSVYSLGYQQGVMECTKSPHALQSKIMQTLLMGVVGVTSPEQVTVVNENDVSFVSQFRHQRMAAVGTKILQAAREHIRVHLKKACDDLEAKLPSDIPKHELAALRENDERTQYWLDAYLRVCGEREKPQPWEYVLIESPVPNAFVTEILPYRFFITTGMLELTENADQLALVLGHEISHLVLGHVGNTNQIEMILRTIEVLLLSLDPTAGVISLFVIGGLAALRQSVAAAFSRDNERQADKLGLQLTAQACFNTVRASHILRRMHEKQIGMVADNKASGRSSSSLVRIMDSHPPSLERFEWMHQEAQTVNYHKYHPCQSMTTRFLNSVWKSSSK